MTEESSLSMAELPEMNPGPVCRLGVDGTIELANRAARETFDDALRGRSWFDVSPRMPRDVWARTLDGMPGVSYEDEIREQCFVFALAHHPGSSHVFIYGSDVTALKEAERKLAELARFPEKNPGPVARLDRMGRIVLANRAARELFDDGQIVGKSWLNVFPGMTGAVWNRIVTGTSTVTLPVRLRGRELTFAHVPPEAGTEVFVYGADVTVQNESERALRQNERMATLGTLAAGVAHELNNPAAAARRAATHLREQFASLQRFEIEIGGLNPVEAERALMQQLTERTHKWAAQTGEFNALARNDAEEVIEAWLDARNISEPWKIAGALVELGFGVDELTSLASQVQPAHLGAILRWLAASFEVNQLFDEVERATGRLSEIVGAMKAYSYVGQAPVQSVDVNEGIRNTLIILRSKLKQGVTVVQQLAEELPRIQAFGGDLNQVWTNLIDNAVAATSGTGTITLRSSAGTGGGVFVEVEDDGPGIAAEHKDRIFDAFFTTKPPGQGTGLGLHTCYNIVVKKHEGTIDVITQPGCTRFIVRLPSTCPMREREG